MAAALDSGTVTRETTYYDTGEYEIGGLTVTNWDLGEYGEQDMTGLLVHSLNVGAAWLSDQMGTDTFYSYIRDFGFGQLTGVDLEGEVIGELRLPDDLEWVDSDLGANSYGQAIAVTPIQMISAVAAVANEGRLMLPHVVSRRIHPDSSAEVRQPVVRDQPISAETAQILTEMLVQVVEHGVPQAQVPGYRIAGKTGTADISVPGGYDPEGTVASFVGYGPASDPELIILVRLDRPQTSRWGSETAAVVFSRLASRLFPMLGILPTD
jgi:cell division protein FtsI/penicillin-binding protein 2